jgi:hypothetical protein
MRSSLLYLLLVGVPLLGLLAILTAGEQLVPPQAVGGAWTVEGEGSPCVLVMNEPRPTLMNVSQSGTRAEVVFTDEAGTRLSLRLEGDSVTGSGTAAEVSGCHGDSLALHGRLQTTGTTTKITGALRRVGCAECGTVDFIAVREVSNEE